MQRIIELAIVMVAVLTPQFLLANEVDGDEFAKATTGVALAGVVVAAYKVYLSIAEKRELRDQRLEIEQFELQGDMPGDGVDDTQDVA